MSQMRWRTFLLWNTLGGITWACTLTAVGYAFGESIERVEKVLGVGGAIVFAVIVVIAALIILRWLHRRQKARTEALLAEKLPDSRVD
jgi:membrane protein DedA with SNARE-associated domain